MDVRRRTAQAIDRHNARMLKPSGDFGFLEKTRSAIRIVGVLGLDLLESHLPIELFVAGDKDLAETAPRVRTKDAKPRTSISRRDLRDGVRNPDFGYRFIGSLASRRNEETRLDVLITQSFQMS